MAALQLSPVKLEVLLYCNLELDRAAAHPSSELSTTFFASFRG